MSHQNRTSGIFKRRVMVFLLMKIWLIYGVLHQENLKNLWYQWRKKGMKSYHVNNCVPQNLDGSDSIRFVSDGEAVIDLEAIRNHHLAKILSPEIIEQMKDLKLRGAVFRLYFKYGKWYSIRYRN